MLKVDQISLSGFFAHPWKYRLKGLKLFFLK